jgi:hypothetical protein
MVEKTNPHMALAENPKGGHLKDLNVDTTERIFK